MAAVRCGLQPVWTSRPSGGRALIVLTMAALLLVPAACGPPVARIPTPTPASVTVEVVSLTVVCPESLTPPVRAAASAFRGERPEFEIVVLSRADTLAMRALRQGDAEIAVLTWLPETLAEGAWARPLARDGLAIVVNPQNGVPGLTMTQLQELFGGRLEDWAAWGGLPGPPQLVARETASGDSAFFQAWVMRDARVSLNALVAPTSEAALDFVVEDALAVAYVSTAWVDGRVRAVVVNGVPPTAETLAANLYPLTRTLFVVTASEPDGAPREFVQWLLAAPGQAVLEAHGFVPVPE
jgi:phosphate transport system substrate-binding protein